MANVKFCFALNCVHWT